MENLVHLELRRQGKEIYYYHTVKEECDFAVRNGFGVETVIQVFFLKPPLLVSGNWRDFLLRCGNIDCRKGMSLPVLMRKN